MSAILILVTTTPTTTVRKIWLNEHEIAQADRHYEDHPVLGPATATLHELVRVVNSNSDGWPYWTKPARAAASLMGLIDSARYGNADLITAAQVRKAYIPIKAFLTRSGLTCEIVSV